MVNCLSYEWSPTLSGMDAYNELLGILKDIAMMDQVRSLLGWDQEVLMPPKAAELRAEQIAWISRESHKRKTDPLWVESYWMSLRKEMTWEILRVPT